MNISDSGPLIYTAWCNIFDLLKYYYERLCITPEIYREVFKKFMEDSNQYVAYLIRKAEAAETYLRQR